MSDIASKLKELLDKNGRGFMPLSAVKSALGSETRKQLGIAKSTAGSGLRKILEPHLGPEIEIRKKGNVLYLVAKGDPAGFVLKRLSSGPAMGPGAIGRSIPFLSKADIVSILNVLIKDGRVAVALNNRYEARFTAAGASGAVSASAAAGLDMEDAAVPPTSDGGMEAFRSAFEELDRGKVFVRICDLRRRLKWSREEFDATVRRLRDEEKIQLHSGDATMMTPDEVRDGFVDENGFRMGTVTWND